MTATASPPLRRRAAVRAGDAARRSLLLVGGSLLATVAYAVTIRAGIGLGPLYAFQDGLALRCGISIGVAVMVTGVGFVVVALCLRTRPGPGTLVLPFLGGFALDWVLPHVPSLHGWPLRVSAVLAATVVMALGGALMFRAAVGVSSYDSVMLGLHRLTGRPLAPLRIGMEATMLLTGWLLGGAVGLGTLLTGLLIGPGMQFWLRLLGGIPTQVGAGGAPGDREAPPGAPGHAGHGALELAERLVEPPLVAGATAEAAGEEAPG